MVYDKIYETLQQPGKSKERSLDSKVHRLINASSEGLAGRCCHHPYQDHGLTRVEITFIGRWTAEKKDALMDEAVNIVRTGLVSKSIHDHIGDLELFLGEVPALYCPQMQELKEQELRSSHKKARKEMRKIVNTIPDGAVIHWTTESTGKSVGRIIASEVNLSKGISAFDKVMSCLAFESPCNLKVSLHILVDGLDESLRGGAPNFRFRRVELQNCADTEECNRMLVSGKVCQGVGLKACTDVYQACGVMPSLLSHLKLAVKAETPTYANTRLYLQHLGNPSGLPVEVPAGIRRTRHLGMSASGFC